MHSHCNSHNKKKNTCVTKIIDLHTGTHIIILAQTCKHTNTHRPTHTDNTHINMNAATNVQAQCCKVNCMSHNIPLTLTGMVKFKILNL